MASSSLLGVAIILVVDVTAVTLVPHHPASVTVTLARVLVTQVGLSVTVTRCTVTTVGGCACVPILTQLTPGPCGQILTLDTLICSLITLAMPITLAH